MSRFNKAELKLYKNKCITFNIVDFGEDMKLEKTSYGCAAKEFKVKMVDYGEDIKIKLTNSFGEAKVILK